jgi:excisionase family DNA binding protein
VRTPAVPREPAPNKLAYSADELAWVLGVSLETAWNLIRAGVVPQVRVGRRVLVARAAVEQFLADGGVDELSTRDFQPRRAAQCRLCNSRLGADLTNERRRLGRRSLRWADEKEQRQRPALAAAGAGGSLDRESLL